MNQKHKPTAGEFITQRTAKALFLVLLFGALFGLYWVAGRLAGLEMIDINKPLIELTVWQGLGLVFFASLLAGMLNSD